MHAIRTKRLVITPWTEADVELASRLWGDPKVMALIDSRGGLSSEQIRQRLKKEIDGQNQFGVSYWKAIDATTHELVGCCGLRPWTFTPTEEPSFEVGFHIVSSLWGKGYATEGAKGVITYAFEQMKLPHLFAGHHPKNVASSVVLTKLGFRHIGDVFYPPTGLNHPSYELRNPIGGTGNATNPSR